MPRAKNVYLVGGFAFVEHPAAMGLWIRTHPCVLKVACSYCKSAVNIPCQSIAARTGLPDGRGYVTYVHHYRKTDAKKVDFPNKEIRLVMQR